MNEKKHRLSNYLYSNVSVYVGEQCFVACDCLFIFRFSLWKLYDCLSIFWKERRLPFWLTPRANRESKRANSFQYKVVESSCNNGTRTSGVSHDSVADALTTNQLRHANALKCVLNYWFGLKYIIWRIPTEIFFLWLRLYLAKSWKKCLASLLRGTWLYLWLLVNNIHQPIMRIVVYYTLLVLTQ